MLVNSTAKGKAEEKAISVTNVLLNCFFQLFPTVKSSSFPFACNQTLIRECIFKIQLHDFFF